MKAAVCTEIGQPLVIEDLVQDPPREEELCVRISACAICHSDISAVRGDWQGYTLPMVVGHEAAGVVEEIGPGVVGFAPGDHVAVTLVRSCGKCAACLSGHTVSCTASLALDTETRLHRHSGESVAQGLRAGAFAERCVVHRSQIVKVAAEVSPVSAALVGCAVITGYGSVTNIARVQPGSSVVVIGAGGVGLNTIQGSAASGASSIIAVDVRDAKLEAALSFGATDTVNASVLDPVETILKMTQGQGADYVFVAVGHAPSIAQSMQMLNKSGSSIILGMPGDEDRFFTVDSHSLTAGRKLLGSKLGDANIQCDVPDMLSLYQSGQLKLDELVSQTYPLEQVNEAMDAVEAGDALRNVIVF